MINNNAQNTFYDLSYMINHINILGARDGFIQPIFEKKFDRFSL